MQIIFKNPNKLEPYKNNARVHTKKQIKQIAASIKQFGFNCPVLVDANNSIIAGHGRVMACKELGIESVPTIAIEHLTEAQKRAFIIADNKLTENADWDFKLLGNEFKELAELNLDFDLNITGFEIGEIDVLIEELKSQEDQEEEPIRILNGPTVTKPGDLWLLGNHRIYCGNSLEDKSFELLMESKKASMVFIDPPFNVPISGHVSGRDKHPEFAMASGEMSKTGFTEFLAKNFELLCKYTTDGSIHYVCMDWRHGEEITAASNSKYTELKNICIWVKDNGGMGSFYRSKHEFIYIFKNGSAAHINNFELGQHGRYRTNVWEYAGANSFARNKLAEENPLDLHPTVKPVVMVEDAIKDCSNHNDIILDSFLGSGTTLIAAEKASRICYGIEISPQYVDTAVKRWQNLTGETAISATTGIRFGETSILETAHA